MRDERVATSPNLSVIEHLFYVKTFCCSSIRCLVVLCCWWSIPCILHLYEECCSFMVVLLLAFLFYLLVVVVCTAAAAALLLLLCCLLVLYAAAPGIILRYNSNQSRIVLVDSTRTLYQFSFSRCVCVRTTPVASENTRVASCSSWSVC